MTAAREAWLVLWQDDGVEETELVTLAHVHAEPGGTIEMTNGGRLTFIEPAGDAPEREAA